MSSSCSFCRTDTTTQTIVSVISVLALANTVAVCQKLTACCGTVKHGTCRMLNVNKITQMVFDWCYALPYQEKGAEHQPVRNLGHMSLTQRGVARVQPARVISVCSPCSTKFAGNRSESVRPRLSSCCKLPRLYHASNNIDTTEASRFVASETNNIIASASDGCRSTLHSVT